jgi:hypothetical protein
LRDAKTLFIGPLNSQKCVVLMVNEEKYRIETPEDEEEPKEKKGLFRPLPKKEEPRYVEKDGRPQPIVKLLGVSMREKRKDLLMLILIPALIAIIDTTIYSYIITSTLESSAITVFLIPAIAAIPIGLTSSNAGSALVSGFICAIFFLIFFITFLISPGLHIPELGIASLIFAAISISLVYFILMATATILGSVIGTILREFL